MNARNAERLQEIFRAVFELSPGTDVTGIRQMGTPAWDSLAHVSLVTAIESEFAVSIEVAEQLRMTSYNGTVLLLDEKGL